jgi:hypothetical protein
MEPKMTFSAEEEASTCKFDTYDPLHPEIDDRLIFYDWLADSTTTSHVTNMHNAFISFKPLQNMPVNGVGSIMTHAKGQGTIELKSKINGYKYILRLEDILYIPTNPQNLLSLGCWDKSGGQYKGGNGHLFLMMKDGHNVTRGTKINNNLYKMDKLTV